MNRGPVRGVLLAFGVLGALLASCDDELAEFGAKAIELGTLANPPGVQGRDGAVSAELWSKSIWIYGDTVLDTPDVDGQRWHHNSFSFTSDLDASDGIDGFEQRVDDAGAIAYFIPPTEDEWAFNRAHWGDPCEQSPCGARYAVWPGASVYDIKRDRALVFYGLIYAEPGDFNFHGVGQSVAVWKSFGEAPARPVVAPGTKHPTLLFRESEPAWGAGAVVQDDDVYSFACDTDRGGLEPPCAIARVGLGEALDRSAWRFWDGERWSAEMSEAVSLFSGAPSLSVSFNRYLGAWTVIYAQPLSNKVVIRTAPSLTGPWSGPKLLFTANKPDEGAYDVNMHHEYEEQDGKTLYATFSRSNGQGWFGSEIALVRVELP